MDLAFWHAIHTGQTPKSVGDLACRTMTSDRSRVQNIASDPSVHSAFTRKLRRSERCQEASWLGCHATVHPPAARHFIYACAAIRERSGRHFRVTTLMIVYRD